MAHGHPNPNSEIEGLRKVVLALLEQLPIFHEAILRLQTSVSAQRLVVGSLSSPGNPASGVETLRQLEEKSFAGSEAVVKQLRDFAASLDAYRVWLQSGKPSGES